MRAKPAEETSWSTFIQLNVREIPLEYFLYSYYCLVDSRLIILCSPSYLMVNDSIQCSFDYEFLIYWLKYTIDWGDGSQPDTWSGRLFNKKLSYYVNHTYTVSGNFSVKAIVLFDSSNYTRLTGSILVQKGNY